MKKILVISAILVCFLTSVFSSFSFAKELKVYNSPTEYRIATGNRIARYNEAPMLADLVKQKKLPTVEQRLPKNPVVIEPWEETGQYGGTWRRCWTGLADRVGPTKIAAYVRLVRLDYTGTKLLPDIAEKWTISKDGKEYTFRLREGLKWSDGTPVTTEDVKFWYEDVLLNKELTPSLPAWAVVAGEVMKLDVIDKYTFKISFKQPYPVFLYQLQVVDDILLAPKHYLKQFHPKYTPGDKLDDLVKKEKLNFWHQLFSNKKDWIQNPDLPVLYPWKVTVPPPATRMILERNPYFYKVDTAGNQLPYIDRIAHDLVENVEVLNMKALAGEIDMQGRHISVGNYTLFMENQKKGDYKVVMWKTGIGADPVICLNQSVNDPVLRQIFQDRRFRIALSLAINRAEIHQICYLGLGKPRQASPISGSPYYDAEWEKLYAEYDPARANRLLDEMGLTKRDKDGIRLRPDGKPLTLTISFTTFPGATRIDVIEMIKSYWEKLGLKVAINTMERSLYVTRLDANEHDICIWNLDRSYQLLIDPSWYVLVGVQQWAPGWGKWIGTGGKGGVEPPSEVKKMTDLWERAKTATNKDLRDRYMKEIANIHKKNLWMIGTVGELPQLIIVKNNFKNVPEGLVWDHPLYSPANAFPEQFFIK